MSAALPCHPFRRPDAGEASGVDWSPDESMTRAQELDRGITALLRDLNANVSADPEFVRLAADFQDYVRDWQAWRKDHLSYLQMVGVGDDLTRWIAGYTTFRARFQKVTGKAPEAPTIAPPAPGLLDQITGAAKSAATEGLVIGLLVLAGVVVGAKVLR